jgi:hypothetical protein
VMLHDGHQGMRLHSPRTRSLAHVPEKWEPVFRTEHAQNRRI